MNKDLADLKPIFINIGRWLMRYFKMILFVVIALIFGYLIWQINVLNHREPTNEEVSQQIEQVKRPSIDTQTADKLRALEDNSSETKALFKSARDNPFQE